VEWLLLMGDYLRGILRLQRLKLLYEPGDDDWVRGIQTNTGTEVAGVGSGVMLVVGGFSVVLGFPPVIRLILIILFMLLVSSSHTTFGRWKKNRR
jgi:hypothetical protein